MFSSGGRVLDAEARTVLGTYTGITPPFGQPQVRPASDRGVVSATAATAATTTAA